MFWKLLLLYAGLFQINLPWQSSIKFKELTELSCELEIILPEDRWLRYDDYLRDFYEAITLPSLKEVFLYDKGDGWNPLQPTVWYTFHAKNVREWMSIVDKYRRWERDFGNKDQVEVLSEFLKDLEWLHSVYDKIDDAARVSMKPLSRRRAIKWVKDQIGEKAWFNMDIPRPEEILFPNWKVVKK